MFRNTMAESSWISTAANVDDDASVAETLSSIGRTMLPDYMLMANRLMKDMAQKGRIRNSDDFAAKFFVPLYENITGRRLKDAIRNPRTEKDTLANLVILLKQLSVDLQNTSLSHIRAEDIVSGDRVATCNLLEILQGLTEYNLKKRSSSKSDLSKNDEPLSTFRSLNSDTTYRDDYSDAEYDNPEQPFKLNISRGLSSSLPHLDSKRTLPGSPPNFLHSPSPPVDAVRPVVVECASMGSSVSIASNDPDLSPSPPKKKNVVKHMRHQMIRAEKRAERVGLIAQLLSNCALVDRMKARSGRRALRQLEMEDNTDRASVDDDETEDGDSVDGSSVCDSVEENSIVVGKRYRKMMRDMKSHSRTVSQAMREEIPGIKREDSGMFRSLDRFELRPTKSFVTRRVVPLKRKPAPASRSMLDSHLSKFSEPRRETVSKLMDLYLQDLPGMSLSDSALRRLQRYLDPLMASRTPDSVEAQRKTAERRMMEEAQRREVILSRMVKREIAAEKRLREMAEARAADLRLRTQQRNARIASARAQKLGEDLIREMKSLRMKATHDEENVLREALVEGTKLERQHRLELEKQVREAEERNTQHLKGEIETLENFYRDQMFELTESAKDERESIEVEAKTKKTQNAQMKQHLRMKLETDIRNFQASLRSDVDDAIFYRRLDTQRAIERRNKAKRKK